MSCGIGVSDTSCYKVSCLPDISHLICYILKTLNSKLTNTITITRVLNYEHSKKGGHNTRLQYSKSTHVGVSIVKVAKVENHCARHL